MVLKKILKQQRLPRGQPSLGYFLFKQGLKRRGSAVIFAMMQTKMLASKVPGHTHKRLSTWTGLMICRAQARALKAYKLAKNRTQKKITDYFRRADWAIYG